MSEKVYTSDFLVFGSGLSGQLFSLKASKHGTVNMVTKGRLTESATMKAQGGIAAVVSAEALVLITILKLFASLTCTISNAPVSKSAST